MHKHHVTILINHHNTFCDIIIFYTRHCYIVANAFFAHDTTTLLHINTVVVQSNYRVLQLVHASAITQSYNWNRRLKNYLCLFE